jgi:hypothetical protein
LLDSYSKELSKQLTRVNTLLNGNFHLENLHRAIQNPDSKYFEESMEKLTNVSAELPLQRMNFDLDIIDFSKPLQDQQDKLDNLFYEKFKNIPLCERSKLLINTKDRYRKVRFNPDNYSSLELPKNLLNLFFPESMMRVALALNFNNVHLCYTPTTWIYLPFLKPRRYSFVVDEKFSSIRTHGFKESIQGMTISIDSIDNIEVQASSQNDRNHPSVKAKTTTTKIDIYFPSKDILLSQFDPPTTNYRPNMVDLSQELLPKDYNSWYMNLDHSEFNRYISEKFNEADWDCKSNEVTNFTDQCFVKGYRPADIQLEFENSTLNGIFGLIEGRSSTNRKLHELIDIDKSNEFRTQIKAESLVSSFNVIQQDYLKCYYRTLLGLPSCEFSGEDSLVDENDRVDWTKLNQLETILKSLVPKFAEFKDGVESSQKIEFNSKFNKLLNSPAYKIVELTQDDSVPPEILYTKLLAELESQGQGFPELINQSEELLQVDIQKLLNMDVYDGLKYYQGLSQ